MMNDEEEIASEMHRWGRIAGTFSIIIMVTSVVLGTATTGSWPPGPACYGLESRWRYLHAVIGLFGSAEASSPAATPSSACPTRS